MTKLCTRLVSVVLMAMLALGPSTAFGQGGAGAKTTTELTKAAKAEFKALSQSAQKKFADGDYDGAIADFEAAYEIRPSSNILYNIGRIHEQQGNIDEAISYYERFVVAPNVEIKARQDAVTRLRTLKEVRDLRDGDKSEQLAEDAAGEKTEPEVVEKPAPVPEPDRTAAWVFLGISATTLVGAGVFGVLTSLRHEEYEEAITLQARRDAASTGETFGYVSDGLLATGVITGIVGAVLWFVATPSESDDVAVSASVGADGATVGLLLTF